MTTRSRMRKRHFKSDFKDLNDLWNQLNKQLDFLEQDAFNGCSDLKEIVFPVNFIKIKSRAFQDCKSLQKLNFNNCSGLSKVVSPKISRRKLFQLLGSNMSWEDFVIYEKLNFGGYL